MQTRYRVAWLWRCMQRHALRAARWRVWEGGAALFSNMAAFAVLRQSRWASAFFANAAAEEQRRRLVTNGGGGATPPSLGAQATATLPWRKAMAAFATIKQSRHSRNIGGVLCDMSMAKILFK